MLKCKNIRKTYQHRDVLRDINLEAGPGELVFLHGINGCGKSTLFKIICDIIRPSSGSYSFADGVKVGALIENPGFIENKSLRYNLDYLANLTGKLDEDYARELCERFELDFDARGSMRSYSLGMREKAGIIQAVMEHQNLILLDEPTRGLDDRAVDTLKNLLEELPLSGKSVVIASHERMDLNWTSVYKMQDGVLIREL